MAGLAGGPVGPAGSAVAAARAVRGGVDAVAALSHAAPDAVVAAGAVEEQAGAAVPAALPDVRGLGAAQEVDGVARDRRQDLLGRARAMDAPAEREHDRRPGRGGVEQLDVGAGRARAPR